jgi:ATP-dependent protease ClpP protease subunit
MASNPPLPPVVYASFAGGIDQQSIGRIFMNFAAATQRGATTVHLLFQSTGGTVGDGIALYNFWRGFPLELHIYNAGAVQSIGTLAYLAGRHRHVSAAGTFSMHKTGISTQPGTSASQIKAIHSSLLADDARTEAIVKANTQIPAKKWALHKFGDVTFNANEAVQFGIAHDISEFVVPPGNQIFNI